MKLKRKVVMLPTNEKAKHGEYTTPYKDNKIKFQRDEYNLNSFNLFFLSDEEIKIGDWFMELDLYKTRSSYINKVYKCNIGNDGTFILTKDINFPFPENCRKIITTTDKSLGLPEPSPEFVEVFIREYNKGNVIEEVMVEFDGYICDSGHEMSYKTACVYPHCDKPNYPKLKVDKNNYITITRVKDSWSREEVINLLNKSHYDRSGNPMIINHKLQLIDSWIEQNL